MLITWKKTLALSYSAANGISTGVTMGYSVYSQSKNRLGTLITAIIGTVISGYSSYAFNGKSIMNSAKDELEYDHAHANNLPYALMEDESQPENSYSTLLAQSLFTTFALSKTIANRYFLLSTILNLFSDEFQMEKSAFITILTIDILIKQLFDMSNELYESNEKIADSLDNYTPTSKPFYKSLFIPIAGPKAKKTFNVIGSLEHALIDDMLPWIGFIPPCAIKYLAENKDKLNILLGISALPAFVITSIVFLQTYYFEGAHTEKHLAEINGDTPPRAENNLLPLKLLNTLQSMLLLMGPFHGTAAALPVYIILNEIFNLEADKFNIQSLIPTLLIFCAVTAGTHYSEVKEAREKIEEMILLKNAKNVATSITIEAPTDIEMQISQRV